MSFDVSPRLMCLAKRLPVTYDLIERPAQLGGGQMRAKRCSDCREVIYPPSTAGRLGHLMRSHGFRMDGRQFNGRNELIGAA